MSNIDSHIEYLEKQNAGLEIKNDFDISSINDLKLKGGAKHLKLKSFNSVNTPTGASTNPKNFNLNKNLNMNLNLIET